MNELLVGLFITAVFVGAVYWAKKNRKKKIFENRDTERFDKPNVDPRYKQK